ncbi:MAG TPA: hypothetical protein PKA63_00500 [Oligoflexia bacterium]|nr:hypothetical protein [Oligoflexia bacterium]HMP47129.1 hypothetical protein [Oligoflexia bacterium]
MIKSSLPASVRKELELLISVIGADFEIGLSKGDPTWEEASWVDESPCLNSPDCSELIPMRSLETRDIFLEDCSLPLIICELASLGNYSFETRSALHSTLEEMIE